MRKQATLLILLLSILSFAGSFAQSTTEDEAVRLLSEYLQIPSVTGNELEAGTFLAQKAAEMGLHIRTFTQEQGRYNFAASLYPLSEGKPNVILLNHIDVVEAGDKSLWKYDPYSGMVANDTVWARGALDCKGLGAMQLAAMEAFVDTAKKADLAYNITLLSVSGEEVGGQNGAEIIINQYLNELNAVVVFGEGGGGMKGVLSADPERPVFGVSVAEKKSLWLKLDLKSKAYGHGAAPPSRYANKTMLASLYALTRRKPKVQFVPANILMLRELGKVETGLKGMALRNAGRGPLNSVLKKKLIADPNTLAISTNTIVITKIMNPPGPANQIANKISATLDCRLLPGVSTEAFLKELKGLLRGFGRKIDVSIIGESVDAPMSNPNDFFIYFKNAIQKNYTDAEVLPMLLPATSDNGFFRAKGIPTFGIMPMLMDNSQFACIHGTNERISVKQYLKGIQVFEDFIYFVMTNKGKVAKSNQ
ncbi:M20/M25/M40 family metallo-hydrolase [Flammeovirgaceae bacterium SG7u.111]|nr:M20/M25/M40 family metallo-hydrolase [Flammeovirgaceae bacterium SG7u.132]WPO34477.1 M20/M25/M40 family metallo-hydrolase [Flammeovirgaceae bacterium SG7u.111]